MRIGKINQTFNFVGTQIKKRFSAINDLFSKFSKSSGPGDPPRNLASIEKRISNRSDATYVAKAPIQGLANPPHSTPTQALKTIDTLAKSLPAESPYFKNVSSKIFVQQLKERVQNPDKLHQGDGTNFCWAAAAMSHIITQDPEGYAKMMLGLYQNGKGSYHNGRETITLSPSPAVRDAVGSQTFKDNPGLTGQVVDQMALLTLADNYKKYVNVFNNNYDPGDEESRWASGTLAKFNDVMRDFGCYSKSWGQDTNLLWSSNKGKIMEQELARGKDIVIFINSSAFKGKVDYSLNSVGTHFIRVKDFKDNGSQYQFKYWDYGKENWAPKTMSHKHFWYATYGVTSLVHQKK